MTWADGVKKLIETISDVGENADELDKAISAAMLNVTKTIVDTMSLARIATALYQIAGLEDDENPEDFTGGLTNE